MRYDLTHIAQWVPRSSRVLDLGCGDGEFLELLRQERDVKGMGLELATENLVATARRGIDVIQQDLDEGLGNFPDQSYDTVVMAHALQVLNNPDRVLYDMVRIGREAIVTFPNFGHWQCRLHLATLGRMPVSEALPYSWYDTPNIHFCTIKDFENLCAKLNIEITARDIVAGRGQGWLAHQRPNFFGETGIFRIRRRHHP